MSTTCTFVCLCHRSDTSTKMSKGDLKKFKSYLACKAYSVKLVDPVRVHFTSQTEKKTNASGTIQCRFQIIHIQHLHTIWKLSISPVSQRSLGLVLEGSGGVDGGVKIPLVLWGRVRPCRETRRIPSSHVTYCGQDDGA